MNSGKMIIQFKTNFTGENKFRIPILKTATVQDAIDAITVRLKSLPSDYFGFPSNEIGVSTLSTLEDHILLFPIDILDDTIQELEVLFVEAIRVPTITNVARTSLLIEGEVFDTGLDNTIAIDHPTPSDSCQATKKLKINPSFQNGTNFDFIEASNECIVTPGSWPNGLEIINKKISSETVFSSKSNVISVRYQTVSNAIKNQPLRHVTLDQEASLIDLKDAIARQENIEVMSDANLVKALLKTEVGSGIDVVVRIGVRCEFKLGIPHTLTHLHDLKRLVSYASELYRDGGDILNPIDMHYIFLNGVDFSDTEDINQLLKVISASPSENLSSAHEIEIFGPMSLPVDSLPLWRIKLCADPKSEVLTCISSLPTCSVFVDNWTLPTSAPSTTTILDLKKKTILPLISNYLQDFDLTAMSQILESDIQLTHDSTILLDHELLSECGLFSDSYLHIACPLLESLLNEFPKIRIESHNDLGIHNPLCELYITYSPNTEISQLKRTAFSIFKIAEKDYSSLTLHSHTAAGKAARTVDDLDKVSEIVIANDFLIAVGSKFKKKITFPAARKTGIKRNAISITTQNHMIRSNFQTDLFPLSFFGIHDCDFVYAYFYETENQKIKDISRDPASLFDDSVSWRSTLGSPITDEGMSCFLSCLYCISHYLRSSSKKTLRDDFLIVLQAHLIDFPPAVWSFRNLNFGNSLTAGECSLISQVCLLLMRKMFSMDFTDSQLFEKSRQFFTYLLTQAHIERELLAEENSTISEDCGGKFVEVTLTCAVRHDILIDPITVSKAALKSRAASSTVSTAPCNDEADKSIDEGTNDFVTISRSSLPSHIDVDRFEINLEVLKLLHCFPHQISCTVWTPTSQLPCPDIVFNCPESFKMLSVRKSPDRILDILDPLKLLQSAPPRLTMDATGKLVVFTGRGKGSNTTVVLFSPLDQEIQTTTQDLALKHKALKLDLISEGAIEVRKPQEAVVICLDVSGSMDHKNDFESDGESICSDGNLSDDENWLWDEKFLDSEDEMDAFSDDDDFACDEEEDAMDEELEDERDECDFNEIEKNGFNGIEEDANCHDHNAERFLEDKMAEEKKVFDKLVAKITSDPSFPIMKKIAAVQGADIVLREICRMADYEYPRDTNEFQTISKHFNAFVAILLNSDNSVSSEDNNHVVPHDLMCPISLELFKDPVVASDGFTYERSSLLNWLNSGKMSSPMTGQLFSSRNLVENRDMKSRVAEWLHNSSMGRLEEGGAEIGDVKDGESDYLSLTLTLQSKPPQILQVQIKSASQIIDLKRLIVRKTQGIFQPLHVRLRGRICSDDEKVTSLRGSKDRDIIVSLLESGMDIVTLKLTIRRSRSPEILNMMCHRRDTVSGLLWRFWYDYSIQPSQCQMFTGLRDAGDNTRVGQLLKNMKQQLSVHVSNSVLDIELTPYPISKQKYKSKKLSRLDTVKQLFHAYTSRTEAYDLANQIGLILFGSSATCECEITPFFEHFKSKVDGATANGDTACYDALNLGMTKLLEFEASNPDCNLRIICLSDGVDNKSTISAFDVSKLLKNNNIVVDVVAIGDANKFECPLLKSVAYATGGYYFKPSTLKEALHLNELETFLSSKDREPRKENPIRTFEQFKTLSRSDDFDTAENATRKLDPLVNTRVNTLEKSLTHPSSAVAMDIASAARNTNELAVASPLSRSEYSRKRILTDMRKLIKKPHSAVDIFPSEADIGFWKLILEGPDSTPYSKGCWILYIKFPSEYPSIPPEVRFITPIYHCNINSQGKVCHSVLDRNWSPDTSLITVFQCVYGLLLSPDVTDPLDSTNALAYYMDPGKYDSTIRAHIDKHASKSRIELNWALQSESCSFEECQEISRAADYNAKNAYEMGKNLPKEYATDQYVVAVEQNKKAMIYNTAAKSILQNNPNFSYEGSIPLLLIEIDLLASLAIYTLRLQNSAETISCCATAISLLPKSAPWVHSSETKLLYNKLHRLKGKAHVVEGEFREGIKHLKLSMQSLSTLSSSDMSEIDKKKTRDDINGYLAKAESKLQRIKVAERQLYKNAFR